MELQLTPGQETKLSRMAEAQGRTAEDLVQEAVDRLLQYEDWFLHAVEEGIAAADGGDFVDHDEVRKWIESRYPA